MWGFWIFEKCYFLSYFASIKHFKYFVIKAKNLMHISELIKIRNSVSDAIIMTNRNEKLFKSLYFQ